MSLSIFMVVMLSALIHATWNSLVKGSPNKYFATGALAASTAGVLAFIVPFVPFPKSEAWIYFAGSVVLQIVYYILLAKTYRVTDIGLSYPLMRGGAPLIVVVLSYFLFAEQISLMGWISVSTITLGILLIGLSSLQNATVKGISLALSNAVVIAIYTIIDGTGVKVSGSAISYSVWLFFVSTLLVTIWFVLVERHRFSGYFKQHWKVGMISGVGSSISYGMVLWSMQYAPIYMVSALRETSIFFVIIFSIFLLKEKLRINQILSAIIISYLI